jgi:ABC-type polysaccharide/polyol phosphate transport system ATPase subunit
VKPGSIVADGVSRRFRVYPQRTVTLKEAIVRRRQLRPTDIWALRDVSFAIEPGESVGLVGRNGSGKTTLLRLIAGIFEPTTGSLDVQGSIGSLIGLGAGFHPEFTGRENVFLNGAIHGLKRSYVREQMDEIVAFAELERFIDLPVRTYSAGMYMRLGFAIATHLRSDVLLLDEVFAVGDEAFQRKCFGKIFEFKNRGGTIMFVSHAASAVESLCERAILLRAGRVDSDGDTHDVLTRYQTLLAEDEDPEEQSAGLQEWGSGEARVAEVRLEDTNGAPRKQFHSGEALVALLRLESEADCPPPRLSVELNQASGGLLGATVQELDELGWSPDGAAARWIRFELESLPLSEGRFQLAVALTGPDGHVYHRLLNAAEFYVYPEGESRGSLRLDGRWSLEESSTTIETR